MGKIVASSFLFLVNWLCVGRILLKIVLITVLCEKAGIWLSGGSGFAVAKSQKSYGMAKP